jgi:hypothetical protein
MQLLTPDILRELSGLTPGPLAVALVAGLMLWLLGWWSHRFWVVLVATVAAGIVGLYEMSPQKSQPLVASLLLALAAGLLALALVRLFAFLAGGFAGMLVVQGLAPALDQPLIVFLACGLVGLLLFRWCVMAATSLVGATLLLTSGIAFLQRHGKFDPIGWAEQSPGLLNGLLMGMAIVGFGLQVLLDRHRRRRRQEEKSVRKKKHDDISDPWSRKMRKAG